MSRTTHRSTHDRGERRPSQKVLVGRTLVEAQPEVDAFLNSVGRHIIRHFGDRKAKVLTLGFLHLTVAESYAASKGFSQNSYTNQDVRRFRSELQQYLDDNGAREGIILEIDPEHPLKWFGKDSNRLALHPLPSPELQAQRSLIESFLESRFGRVERMAPYYGHVVFASFRPGAVVAGAQRNPEILLPDGIAVPERIALNGLMVFLGGIGDDA